MGTNSDRILTQKGKRSMPGRMTTWMRRLFGQRRNPLHPPTLAGELGLPAIGGLAVTDDHTADKLRRATSALERFQIAGDYMRKVRKNGVELAEYHGDSEALKRLDAVQDHLAGEILATAERLKAFLANRDNGGERPHAA
jgi:hypothetical protein